jgi:hypothetical protein
LKTEYNIGNCDRRPNNVDVDTTKKPAGMFLRSDAPISRRDAIQAVSWLKKNFAKQIAVAVEGTRYSVDHICGIACQETAYFWLRLIDKISVEDVCARCVLDASGDAPNTTRKAFPCDTKAFRKEYGDERTDALIEEANKTRVLRGYSRKNWVYKGYGLFQYDLQFVRVDAEFFFEKQWYRFDACLERLMRELRGTWARHGNIFEAIRAYNGAGHRAAVYAKNVMAYSGFSGEVTETMLA